MMNERETPLEAPTRWHMLLALVIVGVSIGVRFAHLDADPTDWYLTGDVAYHVDEGYKTLSAKNLYVFGAAKWDPNDNYRGWMKKSPATQYPVYWAYEYLGLDLANARLIPLAFTLCFFLFTVLFLHGRLSGGPFFLTVVLIATDLAIFQFSRVALFEAALIACLYGSIYLMAIVDRHSRMVGLVILLAGGFATSVLVKAQAPLYFLPAAGAITLTVLFHKSWRSSRFLVLTGIGGLSFTLYYFRDIWSDRLALDAVLLAPQSMFYSPLFALTPVIALIGYLAVIDIFLRSRETLYLDSYRLALAAIVIGTPIILGFVNYNPPRYYTPVIPASILLVGEWVDVRTKLPGIKLTKLPPLDLTILIVIAGSFVMLAISTLWFWYALAFGNSFAFRYADIYKHPILLQAFWFSAAILVFVACIAGNRLRSAAIAAIIFFGIAIHITSGLFLQWSALSHPTFQARHIEEQLTRLLTADESVGGDWAPMLTASSSIRSLYMYTRANRPDGEAFAKPTYFLDAGTFDDERVLDLLRDNSQIRIGKGEPLGTYFRRDLTLYPMSYAEEPNSDM